MLSSWTWRTAERRIGIVGLANSGKTVLLTSLLDHLHNHEPDRFRLGDANAPATLRKFRVVPVLAESTAFDFEQARKALGNDHRWPRKTKDRFEYACAFRRSDWRFNEAELRFFDLPGERLADAAMLGRSYAEWSDRWHQYTRDDSRQAAASRVFLDLIATGQDEVDVIAAYKLALGQAMADYKSYVSPSTFWLDPQGTLPNGLKAEELIAGRFAGLPGCEFAPLPAGVRAARPALAAIFESHFLRYRAEVVESYLQVLAECHSLIVLVDVVGLLGAGTGAANDYRRMLSDLFEVLQPGEDMIGRITRAVSEALFQHRPRHVTKVAFAAPKIDLVHPADRDRVRHLLKSFVGKRAVEIDGLLTDFFTCAAVLSTEPMPGEAGARMLRGRRYRDAEGKRLPFGDAVKYPTSEVPPDWPAAWEAGAFNFPEVYPEVPEYRGIPPKQIGLDRLLDFAMD